MAVQINPNDDVFLGDGHLHQSTQLFIGVKSTQHGIQAPPFVQTMYSEDGTMTEPWQRFWQQAQIKMGGDEPPVYQPFTDPNNKISSNWLDYLQKW